MTTLLGLFSLQAGHICNSGLIKSMQAGHSHLLESPGINNFGIVTVCVEGGAVVATLAVVQQAQLVISDGLCAQHSVHSHLSLLPLVVIIDDDDDDDNDILIPPAVVLTPVPRLTSVLPKLGPVPRLAPRLTPVPRFAPRLTPVPRLAPRPTPVLTPTPIAVVVFLVEGNERGDTLKDDNGLLVDRTNDTVLGGD